MKRDKIGRYVTISNVSEKCKAFVPNKLPPLPPLDINSKLRDLLDQALLALGRLDSVTLLLPETELFLYTYIRKEAVLSSQIEGTQSSLSELLLFELGATPGVPQEDVQEVSNYVAALNYGIKKVHSGFPICSRLIKEMHKMLLSKGRGSKKDPGNFRKSQNWIGGSRPGNATFVPPPANNVVECMGDLEKFLNDKQQSISVLIKAGLAHVQFETIHPFLDGNGRIGRLLITLILCSEAILKKPMLYLSLYFKSHREEYYDLLQRVRTNGNWEKWLRFFLTAVKETSEQASDTANILMKHAELDRQKIQSIGRASGSALRVHNAFLQRPLASISKICELTGLWTTSVTSSIKHLEKLGIVKEVTGKRRNRLFCYSDYIQILNEGTEPVG